MISAHAQKYEAHALFGRGGGGRRGGEYSLKNIPLPSPNQYWKIVIDRIKQVIKRKRWTVLFYHNGKDREEEQPQRFGFKTRTCPPQIDELKAFEEDLIHVAEMVSFHRVSDSLQDAMRKDTKTMNSSQDIIVKVDKTRNVYQVPKEQYSKLIRGNITKN